MSSNRREVVGSGILVVVESGIPEVGSIPSWVVVEIDRLEVGSIPSLVVVVSKLVVGSILS